METNNQPINPIITPQYTEEQLVKSVKQTKQNKWLIPSLVVALIISLGITGIFAYQNFQMVQEKGNQTKLAAEQKQQEQEKMAEEIKSVITPTDTASEISPKVSPISDWETYSNPMAGFSIKHPTGWRVVEADGWIGFGPNEIGEDILWVVSYYDKSNITISEIKVDFGKQFDDRKQTEEMVMLDNKTATKVITTTESIPTWYSVNIIIDDGTNLYVIGNGAQTDEALNKMLATRTSEEYNLTFEDYYSTFKLN